MDIDDQLQILYLLVNCRRSGPEKGQSSRKRFACPTTEANAGRQSDELDTCIQYTNLPCPDCSVFSMLHSHAPVQTLTEMYTNSDPPPNSEKPVAASSRDGAEKQPQKLLVVEPLLSPKLVDVKMIGLLGGVERSSVHPPSQELYPYSLGITDKYFRVC